MRLLRLLFCLVLLCVFGVLLLLVLAQNWRTTQVDFFGLQYSIHLAWVLVGAAAFGVLLTLVLLLPGRFAAMMHTWSLERELRQWEQDLWKLQELREHLLARHEGLLEAHQRLLARHEHLMEAHERVLQVHHRLVGEHSQAIAERDQARAQVVAARTASAHQPARQPSMPRVAVISPRVAGASGAAARIPAASGLRGHGRHGGRGSTPMPRSSWWAAPWPTTHAAVPTARAALATLQVGTGADDRGARKARETTSLGDQPVVVQPPPPPIREGSAGDAQDLPTRERPPAPASEPLRPAVGEPALPRTMPVLPPEPAARASVASPLAPPLFSLRSLQRAAERASVSLTPLLAMLQRWRDIAIAGLDAAFKATRDIFEARLEHLKRSRFSGVLPLNASRSIPSDLPSGDEQE